MICMQNSKLLRKQIGYLNSNIVRLSILRDSSPLPLGCVSSRLTMNESKPMAATYSRALSHFSDVSFDPTTQPSIFVSCPAPLAADIHSTLLHLFMENTLVQLQSEHCQICRWREGLERQLTDRISTWPKLPVLFMSINSSVFDSWMFMYESTLIRRPLYSV